MSRHSDGGSPDPHAPTPRVAALCVAPDASIREVIARIDRNECGIALVVDGDGRLVDTITDGDIRRAMLGGMDLGAPVSVLFPRRATSPYPEPVTAPWSISRDALLVVMHETKLRQVPLVDASGRVVDVALLDELTPAPQLRVQAVVMAGGHGVRLRPLTDDLPKPMLPVGGRPLMERIIEQLHEAGIRRVNVTTHFQADKIKAHFGDGQAFGVDLRYVDEDRPLGTAGALGLMPQPEEPLLVINGDILTQVDFRAMVRYHVEHRADLTIGVRAYEMVVPYGVVESDGLHVQRLAEKPCLTFFVNAGIYLLEPSVYRHITAGEPMDMTDLIQKLLDQRHPVVSFPIREYWLDVGQHDHYAQAQLDVEGGRVRA